MIIDNVDDKNPQNCKKLTPLHNAARNGHFDICKLIIENVDEKNPKTTWGCIPLDLARSRKHEHVYCLFE